MSNRARTNREKAESFDIDKGGILSASVNNKAAPANNKTKAASVNKEGTSNTPRHAEKAKEGRGVVVVGSFIIKN
jgi:hypothetical protein